MNRTAKIIFTAALAALSLNRGVAQENQEVTNTKPGYHLELKMNVPALAVGVVNFGVEVGFGKHSAVELSNISSFNKDNFMWSGKPLILNMTMLEYRYYFSKHPHRGFFVGGDVAWDVFKMHKSIVPGYTNASQARDYDWGYGTTLGVTLGYKFQLAKRWLLEPSVSAGWRVTQHEPYTDGTLTVPMNGSGEWLPYKAGIYLIFKL